MKYNIIYADPPWNYDDKLKHKGGAERHYSTMSTDDICAMKVADIAHDNAALFIWGCWPKLFETQRVIKSWGFKYKTCAFIWVKVNKKTDVKQGSLFYDEDMFDKFWGMGHWTRSNSEFCLLALRGKIKRQAANINQIIYFPIREHSKKPDETRDKIVQLIGDLPRIELFSRKTTPGWHVFGNEVTSDIQL